MEDCRSPMEYDEEEWPELEEARFTFTELRRMFGMRGIEELSFRE